MSWGVLPILSWGLIIDCMPYSWAIAHLTTSRGSSMASRRFSRKSAWWIQWQRVLRCTYRASRCGSACGWVWSRSMWGLAAWCDDGLPGQQHLGIWFPYGLSILTWTRTGPITCFALLSGLQHRACKWIRIRIGNYAGNQAGWGYLCLVLARYCTQVWGWRNPHVVFWGSEGHRRGGNTSAIEIYFILYFTITLASVTWTIHKSTPRGGSGLGGTLKSATYCWDRCFTCSLIQGFPPIHQIGERRFPDLGQLVTSPLDLCHYPQRSTPNDCSRFRGWQDTSDN